MKYSCNKKLTVSEVDNERLELSSVTVGDRELVGLKLIKTSLNDSGKKSSPPHYLHLTPDVFGVLLQRGTELARELGLPVPRASVAEPAPAPECGRSLCGSTLGEPARVVREADVATGGGPRPRSCSSSSSGDGVGSSKPPTLRRSLPLTQETPKVQHQVSTWEGRAGNYAVWCGLTTGLLFYEWAPKALSNCCEGDTRPVPQSVPRDGNHEWEWATLTNEKWGGDSPVYEVRFTTWRFVGLTGTTDPNVLVSRNRAGGSCNRPDPKSSTTVVLPATTSTSTKGTAANGADPASARRVDVGSERKRGRPPGSRAVLRVAKKLCLERRGYGASREPDTPH